MRPSGMANLMHRDFRNSEHGITEVHGTGKQAEHIAEGCEWRITRAASAPEPGELKDQRL
jgi:hypothetical protein